MYNALRIRNENDGILNIKYNLYSYSGWLWVSERRGYIYYYLYYYSLIF